MLDDLPKNYNKFAWEGPGEYVILGEKKIHPKNGNKPFYIKNIKKIGDYKKISTYTIGRYYKIKIEKTITYFNGKKINNIKRLENIIDYDAINKMALNKADNKFLPQRISYFGFGGNLSNKEQYPGYYIRYTLVPKYKKIEILGDNNPFMPPVNNNSMKLEKWEIEKENKNVNMGEIWDWKKLGFYIKELRRRFDSVNGNIYTLTKEDYEHNINMLKKMISIYRKIRDYYNSIDKKRKDFLKNPPKEYFDFISQEKQNILSLEKEKAEKEFYLLQANK